MKPGDIVNNVKRVLTNSWVQWVHEGSIPALTQEGKLQNIVVGNITSHCATCLNLNGCCFVKDKAPMAPLHMGCHCILIERPMIQPYIVCPIEKFTEYLFVENKSGGKKHLFESWGYRIIDSETLASEFRKQANLAYLQGDYVLGNLDQYGQRIGITITIPRKNGAGNVSFLSGWMVYPDGQLFLITPYGGK